MAPSLNVDGLDMSRYATNFSEFVDLSATNDPHGTTLSWWRRVESAVESYYAAKSQTRPNHIRNVESDLAECPNLGNDGMNLFRALRKTRNRVAHETQFMVSREQAVTFAQQALRLCGAIGSNVALENIAPAPVQNSGGRAQND